MHQAEGTDSAAPVRTKAPTSAHLTASEAITWIALGKTMIADQIDEDGFNQVMLWGTSELGDMLPLLEARVAHAPFTPLAFESADWRTRYHGFIGRDWAPRLRSLRGRLRQRERRLVGYREVRDLLLVQMNEDAGLAGAVGAAAHQLLEAVRAGRMKAYGRPIDGALHEEIPVTVLLGDDVEVTLHGAIITTGSVRETLYSDVRVNTAEALGCWPMPSQETPEIAARSGAPGRPSSMHLVQAEFERRGVAGLLRPKLADEARVLMAWLAREHPETPRLTQKTICNRLRESYRNARKQMPDIIHGG